ncbi:Uncharacterized conserved protein YbjT, contains NAD(P)-binding and DUF2867 domains [Evansella caseinilytica]|uniref:Uncharacterized conserved protein YbjT, contains NAD(P)-binding and DUF2867 domains n=1 Tax=Evansella caseinilytica TaxID=1503961 RepID=A0A1H3UWV4_9BACI|nr:NAD(P)H-binding protein [Evansella caseinilytica]SDZ66837.1 Uncharacterized conserved protein YbjT, contains NAD(P)-binding and DUF2867 domains [Evansella caseinilytica]
MKKAVVAGATGLIGHHLVQELIRSGCYDTIRILTRRETSFAEHERIDERVVDFEQLENHAELLRGIDDVFVCLGTTMKKAKSRKKFMKVDYTYPLKMASLAEKEKVTRFLIISSIGADRESRFFYSRVKGKLEEALVLLDFRSLHIFRPSLLTGKRQEFRFGEKVALWMSKPLSALLIGPYEKFRPIKGKYVALTMCAAAQENSSGVHIYESDKIRHLAKVLMTNADKKQKEEME